MSIKHRHWATNVKGDPLKKRLCIVLFEANRYSYNEMKANWMPEIKKLDEAT
ncbi:hypothetical protein [Endozoicomonas lisbonensis]